MFISSSNELGGFESGTVAHFFGPVVSVVSGGVGTIVVVLAWAKLFPPLRNVKRLIHSAHRQKSAGDDSEPGQAAREFRPADGNEN
jgi:hypothetical protein